jgi:hypothetical protein
MYFAEVFRQLAEQKKSRVEEEHLMCHSIQPRSAIRLGLEASSRYDWFLIWPLCINLAFWDPNLQIAE